MKQRIAKLTRPRPQGAVVRRRLLQRLDDAGEKIIWISAPAGSGKTTLAATWLDSRKLPCLWYQADESDRDSASFFSYLGQAADYAAPRHRTPLPLFTSEYHGSVPAFTQRFFETLYARLKPPYCLVIDNYQDVPLDARFHEVVRDAVNAAPEGLSIVIISRTGPPPQFSRLLMNGLLEVIDWDEVRFTLDESRTLIETRSKGRTSEDMVLTLHQKTEGWAAGLVLMAENAAKGGSLSASASIPGERIFDYFAAEVFGRTDVDTKRFLLASAFLPRMSAEDASDLTGYGHAEKILTDLCRHNFFFQRHATPEIVYQYHPLFREFLQKQAKETYNPEEMIRLKKKSAALLIKSGRIEEAGALLVDIADWQGLTDLVLGSAKALMAKGQFLTVGTWIFKIPPEIREQNGWLLYWKAMCRLASRPAEARALLEKAYDRFSANEDAAGLFLSWAGIVSSFLYELKDLHPLDRWISEFGKLVREHDFPSQEIEERATATIFAALMFRQPEHPGLPHWEQMVRKIVEHSPNLSDRAFIGYNLLLYYQWTGRLIEAETIVATLAPLIRRPGDGSPLPALMWLRAEAMHYFFIGQFRAGLRTIEEGLRLSEETGVHLADLMFYGAGIYNSVPLGDVRRAEEYIDKMAQLLGPESCFSSIYFAAQSTLVAHLQGKNDVAVANAERCMHLTRYSGMPLMLNSHLCLLSVMLLETDQTHRIGAINAEIRERSAQTRSAHVEAWCQAIEASLALSSGDDNRAMELFSRAAGIYKKTGIRFMHFSRERQAKLLSKALERDLEPDFVKEMIRLYELTPDLSTGVPDSWPWPLKAYTLGTLEIVKNEKPLVFSGKAQQKPLALLKTLIARGGQAVSVEEIAELLWPDAEGDEAHASFDTTLHRLRKFLGQDNALVLNGGRLSLDQRFFWVDAYAFERLIKEFDGRLKRGIGNPASRNEEIEAAGNRIFHLYQGDFLAGEEDNTAVIAFREKLRHRYLKAIAGLGRFHLEHREWEQAIDCFEKGLKTDRLAEEFYQGLMLCYQGMGLENSAVRTYERCCAALKKGLGLGPSTKTKALYASITENRRPA